jgi:hypothetical protein
MLRPYLRAIPTAAVRLTPSEAAASVIPLDAPYLWRIPRSRGDVGVEAAPLLMAGHGGLSRGQDGAPAASRGRVVLTPASASTSARSSCRESTSTPASASVSAKALCSSCARLTQRTSSKRSSSLFAGVSRLSSRSGRCSGALPAPSPRTLVQALTEVTIVVASPAAMRISLAVVVDAPRSLSGVTAKPLPYVAPLPSSAALVRAPAVNTMPARRLPRARGEALSGCWCWLGGCCGLEGVGWGAVAGGDRGRAGLQLLSCGVVAAGGGQPGQA